MIVVIADDLSGATELAAVAAARGLTAEVQTVWHPESECEVICLDVDTRLLKVSEAEQRVAEIGAVIAAGKPSLVYKKCDSVLRGHPAAESQALSRALGYRRTLLIPANPDRGRIIRDGCIRIREQLLHETLFAHDPDYPRRTSRVVELLGRTDRDLLVPNVETPEQLKGFARGLDAHTLAGGGAEFFDAVLEALGCNPPSYPELSHPAPSPSTVLVCGSAAAWDERAACARAAGVPVVSIADHGWDGVCPAVEAEWSRTGQLLLGIGHVSERLLSGDHVDVGLSVSQRLLHRFSEVACRVLKSCTPGRCLMEGGATAAAVMRAHGWTRCVAEDVVDVGIAYFQPLDASSDMLEAPRLLIKPGSYPWSAAIWPAFSGESSRSG